MNYEPNASNLMQEKAWEKDQGATSDDNQGDRPLPYSSLGDAFGWAMLLPLLRRAR